ncbi:hypothetical protein GOODEAATRI_004530, partial [Goodea atripinnis]
VFSIVVFASITAEGYINPQEQNDPHCMFNNNDTACSYAVGIGILAFLGCVVFLLLDAYFPNISNAKDRKYIVIGDLAFSARYRQGLSEFNQDYTDPVHDHTSPYPPAQSSYQQAPFPSSQGQQGEYQPPTY